MRTRRDGSKRPPKLHTLIIDDFRTAWEKMYWDVDVFGDVQRSYPEEQEPLAYAALNACISASSLENWSLAEWKRHCRNNGCNVGDSYFRDLLADMIPYQGLCVDVANTTKHGAHRENRWQGGKLELKYDEGSEDNPPGFSVLKLHGSGSSYLYNDLHDLPRLWWLFLEKANLVSGKQPTPEWRKRKMLREFNQI